MYPSLYTYIYIYIYIYVRRTSRGAQQVFERTADEQAGQAVYKCCDAREGLFYYIIWYSVIYNWLYSINCMFIVYYIDYIILYCIVCEGGLALQILPMEVRCSIYVQRCLARNTYVILHYDILHYII